MPKIALLLFPLLFLACHAPSTTPLPPSRPLKPGPPLLQVEVAAVPGVMEAEPLRRELLSEIQAQLADWHPIEVPAASPLTATTPRLRVTVERYRPKPAGSPFNALGLPGILSTGAGLAVIQATAGAQEMGALPAYFIGAPLLGLGIAALVLGITFESRKANLDRKRGYPLHTLKAETRIIWPAEGGLKEEKESYRAFNLSSECRPMNATDAADPAKVRREMMRALAVTIREDMGKKTGWGQPEEN